MNFKKFSLVFATAAALALVGCGKNDDESSDKSPTEPPSFNFGDDEDDISSSSTKDEDKSSSSVEKSSDSKDSEESSSSEDDDEKSSDSKEEGSSDSKDDNSSDSKDDDGVKCNGKAYDVKTHFCMETDSTDTIVELCNGEDYYSDQFCFEGEIYNLCGTESYDPTKQSCKKGVLAALCGKKEYDPATQFCQDDKFVTDLCNGQPYTINQFCSYGIVTEACTYGGDDDLYSTYPVSSGLSCPIGGLSYLDERDSAIYRVVQLDTLYWFAENNRFKVSGSAGYDNKDTNIATYGRLYTHAQALKSCPEGWRLPTVEDFNALTKYLTKDYSYKCGTKADSVARCLRDKSSWTKRPTDVRYNHDLEFNWQAAGFYDGSSTATGFKNKGLASSIWLSTKKSGRPGELYLNYASNTILVSYDDSSDSDPTMNSVRCVHGVESF